MAAIFITPEEHVRLIMEGPLSTPLLTSAWRSDGRIQLMDDECNVWAMRLLKEWRSADQTTGTVTSP